MEEYVVTCAPRPRYCVTDAGGQIRCHMSTADDHADVFCQMCWLMETRGVPRHVAEMLACMRQLGVGYTLTPEELAHWEDYTRWLVALEQVTGSRGGGCRRAHGRR
jgi:hypothetical protein